MNSNNVNAKKDKKFNLLAHEISNSINLIKKHSGMSDRYMDFENIIGKATFGSDKEIILEIKVFLKSLSKNLLRKINEKKITEKKIINIKHQLQELFDNIDAWRSKIRDTSLKIYKDHIYEYIDIVEILNCLASSPNKVVMAMGNALYLSMSKYNQLDNPDNLVNYICSEFIFFSLENAKKILRHLEIQGIYQVVTQEVFDSKIIPSNISFAEDIKACFIAQNILDSLDLEEQDSDINDYIIEGIMLKLKICSFNTSFKIFKDGEIAKLFKKLIYSLRAMIASKFCLQNFKSSTRYKLISVFCNSYFHAKWDILFDNKIRDIVHDCHDVILSEILYSAHNKILPAVNRVFEKINLIINKCLFGYKPIFLCDIVDAINNNIEEDLRYDSVFFGLRSTPYCEDIALQDNKFKIIHNYSPYIQYSPDDVEIAPEYFLHMNITEKLLMICLESDSIWHHRGRFILINNIFKKINKSDVFLFNLRRDSKEYLFDFYQNNGTFLLLSQEFFRKILISMDLNVSSMQVILERMLCFSKNYISPYDKDVDDKKMMFLIDFFQALLICCFVKKHNIKYLTPINGSISFDVNYFNLNFKIVSLIFNKIESEVNESFDIKIFQQILNEFINEIIARPLSNHGNIVSDFYFEKSKIFVMNSLLLINNYFEEIKCLASYFCDLM